MPIRKIDNIPKAQWRTLLIKLDADAPQIPLAESVETCITNMLNDGWMMSREIVCSPYVILTFWKPEATDAQEN